MKIRNITSFFLVLILSVAFSSCDSGGSKSEFEILRAQIAKVIASSSFYKFTTADAVGKADDTTGAFLYDNTTDYQIIDVRGSADYIAARVPNADNISWSAIADDESLLESGKEIIIYCKTSNTGGFATALLNILGYNAKNMKWAMMGYNSTTVSNAFTTLDAAVSTDAEVSSKFSLPTVNSGKSSAAEIAKYQYTNKAAISGRFITNADVKLIVDAQNGTLGDGNVVLSTTASVDPDSYQIVSVRAADWYAGTGSYTDGSDVTHTNQGGHISGAVNIPTSEIANTTYLQKLDPSKKQIVYCYTGHTGAMAAAVFNMLGYDAINMKFGMAAWTSASDVNKNYTFDGAKGHVIEGTSAP